MPSIQMDPHQTAGSILCHHSRPTPTHAHPHSAIHRCTCLCTGSQPGLDGSPVTRLTRQLSEQLFGWVRTPAGRRHLCGDRDRSCPTCDPSCSSLIEIETRHSAVRHVVDPTDSNPVHIGPAVTSVSGHLCRVLLGE